MPKRGSTTARGYGGRHQALRKQWAPRVAAGEVNCWRCRQPIEPGMEWDLGHHDHDRSKYNGPEHARAADCPEGGNRATNGRDKPKSKPTNIYIVTGPPASGKTTWVHDHAKPGDITIDFDAIANTLTPPDGQPWKHTPQVQAITKAARQAAIDAALKADDVDVYIIDSRPSTSTTQRYQSHGARIITIDPGQAVVMARCKAERPWQMQQAAKHWYATQQTLPTGQQTSGTPVALGWFDPATPSDQPERRSTSL